MEMEWRPKIVKPNRIADVYGEEGLDGRTKVVVAAAAVWAP